LVAARNFLRVDEKRNWRTFVTLATTLIGSIFVVMASAATRMHLYVEAYGITRERLYVVAILFWLALVFAWFCATILRGRTDRFAAGALASFLVVVVGLNCINPDGAIAALNTSRYVKSVDGEYLSSLSDDATPTLINSLKRLPADAKEKVVSSLKIRQIRLQSDDWRSWDLGAEKANRALRSAKF